MATYDVISDAYDIVYADTAEKVLPVKQILAKHGKRDVLELGVGTGLFAIPLLEQGFHVEGLEISQGMIDLVRQKSPALRVHHGDLRDYSLGKQYEAILVLSSALVLVDDHAEVQQALRCARRHLQQGGLLLLELPNHPVEVKNSNYTQEVHQSEDHDTIVVIQSLLEDEYWREYWHIYRRQGQSFRHEEVICQEFLYSPEVLYQDLSDIGFEIVETSGDLLGNVFDESSSWRRVVICNKR